MKKIITPLAAFISLVFILMKWAYVQSDLAFIGLGYIYYSIKQGTTGGYYVAGLAIIALILIPLSLILKNSARTIAVVGLSSAAIALLFAFFAFAEHPYREGGNKLVMAFGWYGSLISFVIALLGGFLQPKQKGIDI